VSAFSRAEQDHDGAPADLAGRLARVLEDALAAPDGLADAAYDLGATLFAADISLAAVLDAQRDGARRALAAHPDRAADLLDLALTAGRHLVGPYEQQLRQAVDYHTSQRALNDLLRRQAGAIQATNSELARARDAADVVAREKAMFLANMSHEIRTPLNAVVGLASLLAEADLDDEHADYVRTIIGSADHLLFLINDILDFSKIEAGNVVLEHAPFHLPRCLELALDMVAQPAADKGVELAYVIGDDVPEGVMGDEGRLRQVLVNLLSNAVKFSERGEVVVEVTASVPQDGELVLHLLVRDEGIGIPATGVAKLFEPFTQADVSTTRRFGGTGLGLAISSRLVALMGGTLEVESEVGVGSRFSFTVRSAPASVDVAPPPRFDPKRLRGLQLLVVDDNATNRQILEAQARRWGMGCRATGSPAEALEWVRSGERFAAAILDHHMPDVDGVMLAALLRDEVASPALPLLLLSSATRASGDLGPRRELFSAVLTKPIKQSTLLDHVASAIGDDALAPPGPPPAAAEPSALRILVAEDNPVNQKVARRLLERLGYSRVHVVGDGAEAVDALRREPYDVVLMDVQMPVMDGLQASRTIHALWDRDAGRPRIVALTAEAMPGDRERFLAAGMDDYLAKPVVREALAGVMAHCRPVTGWTPPPEDHAAEGPPGTGDADTADGTDGPDPAARVTAAALRARLVALRSATDTGQVDDARAAASAMAAELAAAGRGRIDALDAVLAADDSTLRRRGVLLVSRVQRAVAEVVAELER
jgi:signal transduction histidine kinase/DNA-binding response OmpR family regulator